MLEDAAGIRGNYCLLLVCLGIVPRIMWSSSWETHLKIGELWLRNMQITFLSSAC